MDKKIAAVTGGNRGIGFQICRDPRWLLYDLLRWLLLRDITVCQLPGAEGVRLLSLPHMTENIRRTGAGIRVISDK